MSNSFLKAKTENIQERTLVTGACNSKVICVNPDLDELAEIVNRPSEELKEPSYIGENRDGTPHVRLDIWMRPNDDVKYFDPMSKSYKEFKDPYKLAIFLTRNEISSKDGVKNKYINGKVQTMWETSEEAAIAKTNAKGIAWFENNNVRVCREGEEQIYEFFAKLMNIDLKDDDTNLQFEDYEAILDGNVKELNDLIQAANEDGKTINVLLGVNNGIYQEVYSYSFERGNRKTFKNLIEKANGDYNGFRGDFQNDSLLKSYVRPVANTQTEIATADVNNEVHDELF